MTDKEGGSPFPASQSWLLDNPISRSQANRLVRRLDLEPRMKVLDVGSGPGRLTLPVAAKVGPEGEVWAIDVQQEMLDRVRRRAQAAALGNVRTLKSAAGEARLPSDYFDLALLAHVLGEIPRDQRVRALVEISRALRPRGRLLVLEGAGDPHRLNVETVREVAAKAGLRLDTVAGGWWRRIIAFTRPPTISPGPS